ncbi:MAG TPA: Uma2 family endonuclease [Gemmataceae bacterium]|nr:Uma2 family endonuclease [Gemmataceae bacterium]
MATVSHRRPPRKVVYPTSDGKPMAETDDHRELMVDLIETQKTHFAAEPNVYVSGNLLMYYVRGNPRRHVSPDVFVVFGVPKHNRDYYLVWEEGKSPDVVFELTSKSTRTEDQRTKLEIYRDILKVKEYFLFDPHGDYLDPRLQGYRLRGGRYTRVRPVDNRLPSQVLGLHLEQNGKELRLYNPATGVWLPTPAEELKRLRREVEELRRHRDGQR